MFANPGELVLAFFSVSALALLLGVVVVVWRACRAALERSRARRAASLRVTLLRVATADEPLEADLAALAALDARHWRAVEPELLALLGKLRGSAHAALIDLLRRRGTDVAARSLVR